MWGCPRRPPQRRWGFVYFQLYVCFIAACLICVAVCLAAWLVYRICVLFDLFLLSALVGVFWLWLPVLGLRCLTLFGFENLGSLLVCLFDCLLVCLLVCLAGYVCVFVYWFFVCLLICNNLAALIFVGALSVFFIFALTLGCFVFKLFSFALALTETKQSLCKHISERG